MHIVDGDATGASTVLPDGLNNILAEAFMVNFGHGELALCKWPYHDQLKSTLDLEFTTAAINGFFRPP